MNKIQFVFSIIFLSITSVSFAQNKTYFGVEAGRTKSLFTIGGDILQLSPLYKLQFGVNFGRELNKNFTLEIGAIRNYSDFGYGYANNINPDFALNIFNSWQFPLRLKTNVNIYKEKLFVNLTNGLHFCVNDKDNGAGGGITFYGEETIKTSFRANNTVRYFPLMQTGAGLEFRLKKQAMLGISANYYGGFTDVYEVAIDYRVNQKSEKRTYAFSKGDYWNIACSLRYPISNLWQK